MSRIVALGERDLTLAFAFAGVGVVAADDAEAVRAAWAGLPDDVGLVILTAAAHTALGPELWADADRRMWVVMSA